MAKRELAVQTAIIHSVRAEGGHGRKMSNRYTIGIPDLLICLPPYVPCFAEVKDLGEVGDKFRRQIGITPKQQLELERISLPYEEAQTPYTPNRRTSLILVHFIQKRVHFIAAIPRTQEAYSSDHLSGGLGFRKRQVGGLYEIGPLLEHVGIAKVKLL